MYHQVAADVQPNFRKYTVSVRAFRRQIQWLRMCGYNAISLEQWSAFAKGEPLPPKPVLITFDDGFRSCYDTAVPILLDAGYTAVFYLVTELMGRSSEWLSGSGVVLPIMSWSQARELERVGFYCGAHTQKHARLSSLPDHECRSELVGSRETLESRLGRHIRDLAYPFGSCDDRVRRLAVEAGFESACSVRMGLASRGDDSLMLPRVPVNGNESFLDFVCRLNTAVNTKSVVRGGINAVHQFLRPSATPS
jgi:peptidoglycan/xylan/chitin deacetylase (PgdA/CDA1 family)